MARSHRRPMPAIKTRAPHPSPLSLLSHPAPRRTPPSGCASPATAPPPPRPGTPGTPPRTRRTRSRAAAGAGGAGRGAVDRPWVCGWGRPDGGAGGRLSGGAGAAPALKWGGVRGVIEKKTTTVLTLLLQNKPGAHPPPKLSQNSKLKTPKTLPADREEGNQPCSPIPRCGGGRRVDGGVVCRE